MFRVTTRADFDGLVSAALLSIVEDVDRYRFLEPAQFESPQIVVTAEDFVANLPYRPGCALWFDHHQSNRIGGDFRGSFWIAPSAARVIYEYYSGDQGGLAEYDELVINTDLIDSANLTKEDVLSPADYVLVSLTVEGKDPQDEAYWRHLVSLLRRNDLKRLMADEQVRRHCDKYYLQNGYFLRNIRNHSTIESNLLITDFRGVREGISGNRFLPFALYPDVTVWIKISASSFDPKRIRIGVGHSIFNRLGQRDVGQFLSRFGGGGHKGAGSCTIYQEEVDRVLPEIIEHFRS